MSRQQAFAFIVGAILAVSPSFAQTAAATTKSEVAMQSNSQGQSQQSLTKKQATALLAAAKTPEDHLELAHYYRKEAQRQLSQAAYHEQMAKQWFPPKINMPQHCKDFAYIARRTADKDNRKADEQEKLAAELQAKN